MTVVPCFVAAALIALLFGDSPLGAEPESRSEGRIAFTFGESSATRPSQLAVMDADGKNRRALPPWAVGGLSWSPDGRFIAFAMGGDIHMINADGRPSYRRILRNGFGPDWSPNGRALAFQRLRDIWVVNLKDYRQRLFVRDGSSPTWSADGRKLAFARGADLWVLDVAAKKERRLARDTRDAKWSPDGRQFAFDRCRAQGLDTVCFVYVMRSDGTKQRRLFKGVNPVWSPNGQDIVFEGRDDGRYDAIIRARPDGSRRRVLFGEKPYCGCGLLDWGPRPRR